MAQPRPLRGVDTEPTVPFSSSIATIDCAQSILGSRIEHERGMPEEDHDLCSSVADDSCRQVG